MKTNIKNIRKSSNTKIVIISDDKTILEKDLKNLYSDFEDIKIISSSEGINFKNMSLLICAFVAVFILNHLISNLKPPISN